MRKSNQYYQKADYYYIFHILPYLLKDSIVINKRSDNFITTHTTSVRIDDSSSSGRSGSSTHRSSSGRSHGGGGRRL